jgi:hypothetical protein
MPESFRRRRWSAAGINDVPRRQRGHPSKGTQAKAYDHAADHTSSSTESDAIDGPSQPVRSCNASASLLLLRRDTSSGPG